MIVLLPFCLSISILNTNNELVRLAHSGIDLGKCESLLAAISPASDAYKILDACEKLQSRVDYSALNTISGQVDDWNLHHIVRGVFKKYCEF